MPPEGDSLRGSAVPTGNQAVDAVNIRRACGFDASALAFLAQDHAAFERSVASCDAEGLARALDAKPPLLFAWVAERTGEPVGYARATVDYSTWRATHYVHLDCLFVVESHRKRGVGGKLIDAIRRYAAERGLRSIEWQTPVWNCQAIQFYERFGAERLDKARFRMDVESGG